MSQRKRLLLKSEYAKHRGCSAPYVSKLCRTGRIPTVGGKIDPVAADAALAESRDPGRAQGEATRRAMRGGGAPSAPSGAHGDHGAYTNARARREAILAKQAELDYLESVAGLVEMTAAADAVRACGTESARLLETIPKRIAASLAAALGVSAEPIERLIEPEVRRACDEVARTVVIFPALVLPGTRH